MASRGIICYGILFKEGFAFPWGHKFPEKLEPTIHAVNYCNEYSPMYIFAIPESVGVVECGLPAKITEREGGLKNNEKWNKILFDFCDIQGIKIESMPEWYLAVQYI